MKISIQFNTLCFAILFSLLSCGYLSAQTAKSGATAVIGLWLNEEKDARIELYQQKDQLFGKIVWLREPNDPATGKPKLDTKNPDARQHSQPILGSTLVRNFRYDGNNTWVDGEIYDGRAGRTYSCKITLTDPNTLRVRGFVGISLLGKTTIWTRLK